MQPVKFQDTPQRKKVRAALQVLQKFFLVTTDVFEPLSDEHIIEWATQITLEGLEYKLRNWQYNWLIGA